MTDVNPHLAMAPVWRGGWPAPGDLLVISLHGRGRTAEEAADLAARLGPGVAVLAPAAFEQSWYPQRFMAPLVDNQPRLDQALAVLDHWVGEAARQGVGPERIVWLGFSQGACLACDYVWRRPQRWGGLISFTGGLIGPPGSSWPVTSAALAEVPVLMTNGDEDPWVPLQRTRDSADVLRAAGARVSERVYAGRSHDVLDDEVSAAADLFRCAAQSFDR